MLSFDQILVFIVLVFILISLYREILGPAFTFLVGVIILGIFGVLTPAEILRGFGNEQIAVVIMLLLIGDVIRRTAVVEVIFDRFFKSARSNRGFMSRMILLIAGFSAFLNNTPLVAVMIPYVHSWCKRNNISPSKFLIPLSYAAILGGCATLIGTSTNLIVNGLVLDQTIIPDLEPLKIFDFAIVGIPMIVVGTLYLLFFGERLLPTKPDTLTQLSLGRREYMVEAKVVHKSPLIGKTIEEAGLRSQPGFHIVEIWRRGYKISVFGADFLLDRGDILIFAGETEAIADMVRSRSGLSIPEVGMLLKKSRTEMVEVVVSQNSSIMNKTVREAGFRSQYDAAIVSVHRNGELIKGKIGEVILKAGDVLLLFTGENFVARTVAMKDFYFISKVSEMVKLEWYKSAILLGGLILAILLAALNLFPLFISLLLILVLSLAMRITHPRELPGAIDYNLALIIVLSLALGTAMIKTGTADLVADGVIRLFRPLGVIGILTGIYLITTILAAYITSKAAAAIIFPIALTTAVNLSMDPMPFILITAYASAANFMTPVGFQTNLMVYGPGGYSFNDFFRIGAPLTLLYMIVTITILSLIYV
ncbi:MAG: SLC13 family permease [Bacteroidales bacterium]|nr:SLC13 family permease [Bacteroidales bacterium]